MIKNWQDFLDSLSTKGGNILMMFVSLVGLIMFAHHISLESVAEPSIISAAHDMMVGFGAALLAVLSGSSSRQQMIDRKDSVTPPTVEAGKVTNLTVNQPEKVVDSAPTKPLP